MSGNARALVRQRLSKQLCSSSPAFTNTSTGWWSPGAVRNSSSRAWPRVVSAERKHGAASLHKCRLKKSCVMSRRELIAPAPSNRRASSSRCWRPNFAAAKLCDDRLGLIFLYKGYGAKRKGHESMKIANTSNRARIILAALVLILGAFWAGARFGPRQPTSVGAVPRNGSFITASEKDGALTED